MNFNWLRHLISFRKWPQKFHCELCEPTGGSRDVAANWWRRNTSERRKISGKWHSVVPEMYINEQTVVAPDSRCFLSLAAGFHHWHASFVFWFQAVVSFKSLTRHLREFPEIHCLSFLKYGKTLDFFLFYTEFSTFITSKINKNIILISFNNF